MPLAIRTAAGSRAESLPRAPVPHSRPEVALSCTGTRSCASNARTRSEIRARQTPINLPPIIERGGGIAAKTAVISTARFRYLTVEPGSEDVKFAAGERAKGCWLGCNNGKVVRWYALARMGAILVPLNWRLTPRRQGDSTDCTPQWIFLIRN